MDDIKIFYRKTRRWEFIPDFDKPLIGYSLEDLRKAVCFFFVVYGIVLVLVHVSGLDLSNNYNSFDGSAWDRSGIKVVTDRKTGIEYLKTKEGFLTPRMEKTK